MTQNRLYPSAAAIAALVIVFLFTSNSFAQAPTVNQPYRLSSGAETVIGSVKLTSDNLYSVYVEGDLRVQEGALFSVRLIDGVRRRLSPPLGPDERVFDFRISSDNATVAFVVDNSRTEGKTLYRVDVDGSNREIIAGPLDRPLDSISFLQYVFANNGQHILYQLFGGPLKGLYAVSSAGGDSTRLDPPVANPGGFLRLFAGTNNIDFALFSANLAEGGVGIYKVSFNGGEVEKISAPVANTLQRIQKTEVSADGNYVVYAINGLGGAEMQLISIDLRTNQTRVISGPIDSRITSLAAESLYFDGNSKVVYRTRALSFSPVTLNAYWVTPLDGSEPAQPLSTPLTESQGIGSVVERSATDQHFYYSTFTPGSDGAAATEKIFRANVLNQSVVEIQSMVDSRTFQGNLVESSDFATVLISSFVGPTRPQRNRDVVNFCWRISWAARTRVFKKPRSGVL